MLSIFKKMFGKPEPKAAAAPTAQAVPPPPSTPIPTIEVAHLSLAAIVERFPDDLKPLLISAPDPAATVALPLPTILKQLPTGSVKMSLASLHRQAHGLIKPLPPGDKRSVEVPLAEVFRHVRLDVLRRREQRHLDIPDSGFNLFSDASNPYAISPDAGTPEPEMAAEPEPQVLDLTEELPEPARTPAPQRVLKMDDSLRANFSNGNAGHESQESPAVAAPAPTPVPRVVAPPAEFKAAAPTPAPVPAPAPSSAVRRPAAAAPATPAAEEVVDGPTLPLPVASLSGNWPDPIRSEIAALDPATTVSLPVNNVTAGLARGRVNFTWQQIQAWLQPPLPSPSQAAGETMLPLPLKVVAPAFLSASKKPAAERKTVTMDESIPSLFTDGRPPEEKPVAPAPEPEPAPEAAALEPTPTAEQAPAAEPTPAPEHAPAEEHAPEPVVEALPEPPKLAETVGEIFHQTQKTTWTPAELVAGTVTLPGVAGAIVALQEGLVVAASLPEGVKSDVVAAFLPQIFARLNQYSGEMKLGDVDDLLFTTHGAHCQIYRLGYVYFAVLGQAGESLPWHELRLITEELARNTHK